jgi:hypothetical protein
MSRYPNSLTASLPVPARSADRGPLIDGGWWPRSNDLAAELPALLEEIFPAGFDVTDVMYNHTVWEPAPPQLTVAGHRVSLHGDAAQDPASVQLFDSTGQKPVVVVVIPPNTESLVAENALALAGRDGDLHRPDQIVVRAELQAQAAHPGAAHPQVTTAVTPPAAADAAKPIAAR